MKKEVSVCKVKVEIADVAGHTTCQSTHSLEELSTWSHAY